MAQVAGGSGFSAIYNLVVSLSTMAAVVPYAFCALATGLVAAYAAGGGPVPRLTVIEVIAFVFSVFTLYGCGPEAVLYGFMMLAARNSGLRLAATPRRDRQPRLSCSLQRADHVLRCLAVRCELMGKAFTIDHVKSQPTPYLVRSINGDQCKMS